MFDTTRRDGVCRLFRHGTRWLSTGYAGGESRGPAAYNITVPDGWPETDLDAYIQRRVSDAGFEEPGPTLLTGVDQRHARRARFGPVEVVATAGVSNPAELPTEVAGDDGDYGWNSPSSPPMSGDSVGTVNVFVGTTRSLEPGALSNLVAVAAEAKAATLLARCSAPGTTSDAVIAACDPEGEPATFSGSATEVGHAARVCVRDAVLASLDSRYASNSMPQSVDSATYGVVADDSATVSTI
ncbi:adenosylcobinamide amidohydrolase [Haloferax mediterranei ATCC 33500]|uniref:Adenosylcobinamide amidohydrolase n=1 Tax=Haloferax mediterranei (strain ATCC 33500 / DSM 1411 / JCM 8866 / NBRC 14739 / NCIMB 2177 / R-4) TaxID=523841 RepID=I3R244_HALMT|nr:adenosylcobinamide amidohydrolase [Haloferax mediterranei]AFK18304.1 adenosylcobinamide amidohydrolase [Haloferax mediterranei ATCC 33500]AHZ22297.1 adenosylcobinamide amidohydrolase [Haloferax mediterranei ATCC 33500]EMA02424.1 adenosylcobinamide amidohydrolase [Haloferax mediterranei ATCC 33500]MDX5988393.1 adenosylcobinamide amidohydrolase [Haloferax mediterranei ATCC 33500]QCQ74821.1 adenosylcobinamide amidohydrolase [Haloferax mediterranei ATCC 33500]